MRNTVLGLILISALALFSMGCDSDSGSDSDTDDIDGLWAYVPDDDDEGDIRYIRIAGGQVSVFDFMGDEFDGGPDCYEIEHGTLERQSGNQYELSAGGLTFTVSIIRAGNQLTVNFGAPFGTETYTRSNLNVSSFQPECEEDELEFTLDPPLLKGNAR